MLNCKGSRLFLSFSFFCPKKRIFKAFTHNVTVCVVIIYLAVFSQAWIDAYWNFMFSFRRKLLILEEKKEKHFCIHSLLIYSFKKIIEILPCDRHWEIKSQKKNWYHPFSQNFENSREFIAWGDRVWWGQNTGFPFKEPWKNLSIFTGKMNTNIH